MEETKTSIEKKDIIVNEHFKNILKNYDNYMIFLNEKRENTFRALNDDMNFNMLLENIKQLGVEIKKEHKDQFRIDYKSFVQDFILFLQQVQELPKNSNAIALLFDRIIAVCEFIRKQQTTATDLATGEQLSNKLWPLFCEYFFNVNLIYY